MNLKKFPYGADWKGHGEKLGASNKFRIHPQARSFPLGTFLVERKNEFFIKQSLAKKNII